MIFPAIPGSLPELREAARTFARRNGMTNPENVALAITEACENAVLHAEASDLPVVVRLTAVREGNHLVFMVADRAPGPQPLPSGDAPSRLPLIASVAEHVTVADSEGASRIQISFAAPQS